MNKGRRRKSLDRWRSNLRWKKMNHRQHINKAEREREKRKMSIRNLNETCISDARFDLEMKPQSVWKISRPASKGDIIE
jgi:hypothetical protein